MTQHKHHSALESIIGTLVGFIMSLAIGYAVYPHFDMKLHSSIIFVTTLFTIISLVRGYYVRRLFNWLHVRGML